MDFEGTLGELFPLVEQLQKTQQFNTCKMSLVLSKMEITTQKSEFPIFYQFHRKGKMMKRAMISQPLAGKTEEEIAEARVKAIKELESMGYEVVNTLFTDEWYSREKMKERGVVQIPLCFLAKSLENMCKCHAVYFCKGWAQARGCRIEHAAALSYGLEILNDRDNATEQEEM